jgi:hypothetical protein
MCRTVPVHHQPEEKSLRDISYWVGYSEMFASREKNYPSMNHKLGST